jgi:predicted nucleic acid-binding Zn ribbon protein
MNCPNCRTQILIDQQFCRSCGAELTADRPRTNSQWMLGGLILAFAGIMVALLGRMLLHEEIVTLIGVMLSISGMFLIAANQFIRRPKQTRRVTATPVEHGSLPAVSTNKLLPFGNDDYIPASVTENTTNLLMEPVSDRRD